MLWATGSDNSRQPPDLYLRRPPTRSVVWLTYPRTVVRRRVHSIPKNYQGRHCRRRRDPCAWHRSGQNIILRPGATPASISVAIGLNSTRAGSGTGFHDKATSTSHWCRGVLYETGLLSHIPSYGRSRSPRLSPYSRTNKLISFRLPLVCVYELSGMMRLMGAGVSRLPRLELHLSIDCAHCRRCSEFPCSLAGRLPTEHQMVLWLCTFPCSPIARR